MGKFKTIHTWLAEFYKSQIKKPSDFDLIISSGLFDESFYRKNHPEYIQSGMSPVRYFQEIGCKLGHNPSAEFDSSFYSIANPEYKLTHSSPLLHYLKVGKKTDALTCSVLDLDNYKQILDDFKKTNYIPKEPNVNETLRLGLFTHNLNLEGATLVCKEIAFALKQTRAIEPIIFSPFNGILKNVYESAGIQVVVHPPFNRKLIKNTHDFSSNISELADFIKPFKLNAIYANTIISFWCTHVAQKLMLPTTLHIHESEPLNYHFQNRHYDFIPSVLTALAYSKNVVFVSDNTFQKYQAYNINNNFCVIKNAFDRDEIPMKLTPRSQLRKQMGIEKHEFVFLNVGTVCSRKGQIDILNAVKLMDKKLTQSFKILMVGDVDTNYSRHLHSIHKNLPKNLAKNIHFISKTSNVFDYYNLADGFLFSSRIESYPKVIQEAMFFKLPIISTPVDGITEQIQHQQSGLFYKPGDASRLSALMEELILNEKLRSKLGKEAKHALSMMTSPDKMIREFSSLILEPAKL